MFRKSMCFVLSLCIINVSLTGCGGSDANPVTRYMRGDEKRSCVGLRTEIAINADAIVIRNRQKKKRDVWNTVFIVGGVLVIIPFFFINVKCAYETEIEALKVRNTMLKSYLVQNDCYSN